MGCDVAHRSVKGRHVGGAARANTEHLRRSVDGHQDDVCACDGLSVTSEEEILSARDRC
jgi:hypothetical protein